MAHHDAASVRIVSVDHYLSKPDPQFDVCYAEFRGTEVKQVPVIRLFGTTPDGTHSCVHIHGVFPYFYIPYGGSTSDRLEVDKYIYQLATALDKAINVSLARSASNASHIFKIVLVKGIPIYGYHRNAHNYLKIYMYNPRLIRNATQLLMNGAIPSAMPQVHETHVPYVLQFFIDYNLYGMSFLHLNVNGLRQRTTNAHETAGNAPPRMSSSEYEIDALASNILNRALEQSDTGEFANPGIASIWKDEQTRRRLFGMEQPEHMNLSQDGPRDEVITESDRFYRALLASKLLNKQTPTKADDRKATPASAYPSEATEGVVMLDASSIANHGRSAGLSNESLYASQISYHFDGSVEVDERKIMFMSENNDDTLRDEDYNLLEILRELEENEKNNFEDDSLLAPLTQSGENGRRMVQGCTAGVLHRSQTSKRLNASMCGELEAISLIRPLETEEAENAQDNSFDSDDEFLLDLTQKQTSEESKNLNLVEEYLNDSGDDDLLVDGGIPQLDGADDSFASRTPKRNREGFEPTPENSSLAKRIRIDSTQPVSKKSLTPRRVSFALSPPNDKAKTRSELMRKQFEKTSENKLKNIEIRVPKLTLMNKTILNRQSPSTKEQSKYSPETSLKSLRIRLTKLDPSAYEMVKHLTKVSPEKVRTDRYSQAFEYDQRNNFDPLEGPSSLNQSNRVRKTDQFKTPKGPSNAKRLKLEEQQEIEVILSEKFRDIIRLSPKVLIKPLAMGDNAVSNSSVTVSKYTPEHQQSLMEKCSNHAVAPNEKRSSDSESPDTKSGTNAVESLEKPKQTNTVLDEAPAGWMDVESGMNGSTPVSYKLHPKEDRDVIIIGDEAVNVKPGQNEKIITIDIDDGSSDENAATSRSQYRSNEPMVVIHVGSTKPLPVPYNKQTNPSGTIDVLDSDRNLQSAETHEKKEGLNNSSNVSIGSQLDGVLELMQESDNEREDVIEVQSVTEEEEGNLTTMHSICETTMVCEVDEIVSESDESLPKSCNIGCEEEDGMQVTISLATDPPTREQAEQAIASFEIPAVVNTIPFYSNPADVTGRKEIGHTVLQIVGKSLNDLEEFKSTIPGLQSIKHFRYGILQQTYGEYIHEVLPSVGSTEPNADRIKLLLASESSVTITPSVAPPNRDEANTWIRERIRNRQTDSVSTKGSAVEQDSPIKVKKADTIMSIGAAAEPVQSKIDSESSLNLSVLLWNDEGNSSSNGESTKKLASKIMAMSTCGSLKPNPDNSIKNDVVQHKEVHTEPEKPSKCQQRSDNQATLPRIVVSSDQSEVAEESNANISAATPLDNTYGFQVNYENLQQAKPGCEHNYLTIMSIEMHVQTRGDLRPNPSTDPIASIFYRIHNDVPKEHPRASSVCGIILNRELCGDGGDRKMSKKYNQSLYVADVVLVASERELYEKFLLLIAFWDPDIFTGYEIECASWGYVIERGYALEMNLMKMLSRVPTVEKVHVSDEEEQELLEMHDYSAGLKIAGRILLDIWRLMRHEIALTSYTFENVAYHILHRRLPCHSYRHLTRLWNKSYSRWIVLDYYLERVNGNFEILNQLDLIGRTAELAKLFGIQFYEVLSRGSQFRVESMMLRIAKPWNFVSVSPTIQQRAHMRAPEYLPLIMEPSSRFYPDPIIVLDFQSLYPSVIIAYNYCFSTCLGRIEHLGESSAEFEFGASHLRIPPKMLKALLEQNLVTFSPCGVAFVKNRVREGVLPRMLSEILNTRLMVKKSMKLHKNNSVLQRVLHSRQLGLKLIANVTYGYTAANFSGRMPCVEIGDSVVAKGRETLERAIKLVEETERWGAKVVYGDTDSLFVLCPGRTKAEAFKIGEEIVEAVSRENPPPIKLKLEKVYQPSILQTKKRYVGYMYETADQEKPTYEAKGIETVRRDGCPVVAKMLEKVLRILFETCDVSKVKQYTCRQFTKILEGRVNLQDFIFAKEFRGEDGYKPGACVPALQLWRKWKLTDPRREPRRGQRVPYVIVNGPPLVPLIRLVRSPDELLANEGLKINANYYISKAIIPPLNRCLLLIGADVNQWYNELPRKTLMLHNTGGAVVGDADKRPPSRNSIEQSMPKKSTISQYFSSTNCIVDCGRQTQHGVCKHCQQRPQHTALHVMNKINKLERKLELTEKVCRSCCQRTFETSCISLDCPVIFALNRRTVEHKQTQYYRELLQQFF